MPGRPFLLLIAGAAILALVAGLILAGVKRVVVVMDHANKHGQSKVLKSCTLPLTGTGVVSRIITDLCVFDVKPDGAGLELIELADGVTLDEVAAKTEATYPVAEDLKA